MKKVMKDIFSKLMFNEIGLDLSGTLPVTKTIHFHKLKYLFKRFRCRKHPFSRTTYNVYISKTQNKLIHNILIDILNKKNQKFIRLIPPLSE